jgi:hypothetical protein
MSGVTTIFTYCSASFPVEPAVEIGMTAKIEFLLHYSTTDGQTF